MCSILAIVSSQSEDSLALRQRAIQLSQRQRHRGPDGSGIFMDEGVVLAHNRLAILDPVGGAQPLVSVDGRLALVMNGEIYNYPTLRSELGDCYAFVSGSDCEVINALSLTDHPLRWLNRLNGIFAFALWDQAHRTVLIARDPIGICPLYWGHGPKGALYVASEMKTLVGICDDLEEFPPGHFFDSRTGELGRFCNKWWRDYKATQSVTVSRQELREAFERAVRRQLVADVPYGVLLSGGLDSSLVTACATRALPSGMRLHSFAIGLEDSRDLAAAEIASRALQTDHHSFRFTFDEGFDALPEVIRHIETYDLATVRASAPMYLMAKRIRSMGFKLVLSGEGADEVFGGYLYFHKAPNAQSFHEETIRKLDALHSHDCLRVNKAMLAYGIEARVPFLDLEFLDVAMKMDARAKMADNGRIEKAVLREAFETYLPADILWRQKEQFSDGVGYSWVGRLKQTCEHQVSDKEFAEASERFPFSPPRTKEAYFYRRIFEQHFPGQACAMTVPSGPSIACSSPVAIKWDASFKDWADPSGRSVSGVHASTLATAP
jgi:asparagine synthase (glutamine-hydrolysing)